MAEQAEPEKRYWQQPHQHRHVNHSKRSASAPPRSAETAAGSRRNNEAKQWNNPPKIQQVSPKLVPNRDHDRNRVHFLDSVHIRRLFPERPVMTRPVNHVATHTFDTCDYKTRKNPSAVLDTNHFCRSIAFKDPNTNVNHIISFENFYDFWHEYEEPDPSKPVDLHFRPQMDIEKQVQMSVQIVVPEKDKQLSENKYLYSFKHTIRVYCPHAKLQTWATTFKPSEIIDYCDVDPYLSASTAINPTLLQVHFSGDDKESQKGKEEKKGAPDAAETKSSMPGCCPKKKF